MTMHRDDDIARDLQAELRTSLVRFDPALAQTMIHQAIAASVDRGHSRARWAMPLLASGAVAAVVGGVAGVTAMRSDGRHVNPGGGPLTTSPAPTPEPGRPRAQICTYGDPKHPSVPVRTCNIVVTNQPGVPLCTPPFHVPHRPPAAVPSHPPRVPISTCTVLVNHTPPPTLPRDGSQAPTAQPPVPQRSAPGARPTTSVSAAPTPTLSAVPTAAQPSVPGRG